MKIIALALLIAAALIQGPAVQAGNKSCDTKEGPPCAMERCAGYTNGVPTGAKCIRGYCKKECCHCPTEGDKACPLHQQEPDPEQ